MRFNSPYLYILLVLGGSLTAGVVGCDRLPESITGPRPECGSDYSGWAIASFRVFVDGRDTDGGIEVPPSPFAAPVPVSAPYQLQPLPSKIFLDQISFKPRNAHRTRPRPR